MIFLEANNGWFVPLNDQLYIEQRLGRDPETAGLWDVRLGDEDNGRRLTLYSCLSLEEANRYFYYIKLWMMDYQAAGRPLYVIPKPEWLKER